MKLQKTIRTSRKGMAFDIVFSIMWIIYLTLVLIVIVTLISFLLMVNINILPVETDILTYHFLYSRDGFSYRNEDLQRNYPNLIDIGRFNQETLNNFKADQEHIAARFTLRNIENGTKTIVYYNQEWFDRWYGLAVTGVPGPGGATMNTKDVPVTITDSTMSKVQKGTLTVEIVAPNS